MIGTLGFVASPAFAKPDESNKVTICHATGSESNPYVLITVNENSVEHSGHSRDKGDIIPATDECIALANKPTATATATATPTETPDPLPTETAIPSPSATDPIKGELPNDNVVIPPHGEPSPPQGAIAGPVETLNPSSKTAQPTAPTSSPVEGQVSDTELAYTGFNWPVAVLGTVLLALGIALARVNRKH